VEADSLLEKALGVGRTTAYVNSHHHQAISKVGNDLRATAYAADGVVEAVEDTRSGRFTFGAQWHPELDWQNDSTSQALFSEFVKVAGGRMVSISNG
jgi:putative glutamine amidotransferase